MEYINEKLEKFNKFLDGKQVAIIGLGVSNIPLLDYFYDKNAKVTVFSTNVLSDDIMDKINKYRYQIELGENNLERLKGFDIIFRSPSALPTKHEFQSAVKKGAILTSEIEMVLKLAPCKIIGVTGTEGKTTTTSLIYEICKKAGYNCYLGGNIGKPIFTKINEMKPDDLVILELSSFQLMGMSVSPNISVVTNVYPDHLNIHKSYEEYQEAKKSIFKNQSSDGIVVLNKGAIEQQGKPEEIYQSPSTPFTAKFIGKSNWLDQDTMFRPETASLEKKDGYKEYRAVVDGVQFLGENYQLYLDAGGKQWIMESACRYDIGSDVSVYINEDQILTFQK